MKTAKLWISFSSISSKTHKALPGTRAGILLSGTVELFSTLSTLPGVSVTAFILISVSSTQKEHSL